MTWQMIFNQDIRPEVGMGHPDTDVAAGRVADNLKTATSAGQLNPKPARRQ